MKKLVGEETDLLEVARFWKLHHKAATAREVPCRAAWSDFIVWLKESGRATRTVNTMRYVEKKFCATFGDAPVASVDKDALLAWVGAQPVSERTKRNLIGHVTNFFNWCKIAKSWIFEVPAIDERLLPKAAKNPVGIWTFPQAQDAIRAIEKSFPQLVPHFALRLFAGLRTAEARKMRWEWINFEKRTILVPAEICKTRDAWIILPAMLPLDGAAVFAFLEKYRRAENGAIPAPSAKAQEKIARLCGWKPNVMRHTFATMHVAFYGDETKTILATRHTNLATLRAHYRGVNQTRADAEAFFALLPEKSGK